VVHAGPEYVGIRRKPGSRGAVLKFAYKDVRLTPKSTLLQELDALENAEYTGTETHDPNVSTPTGNHNSSDHQVDNEIVLNN
jgi:hypothetical protein